jgi:hypothetical protein
MVERASEYQILHSWVHLARYNVLASGYVCQDV